MNYLTIMTMSSANIDTQWYFFYFQYLNFKVFASSMAASSSIENNCEPKTLFCVFFTSLLTRIFVDFYCINILFWSFFCLLQCFLICFKMCSLSLSFCWKRKGNLFFQIFHIHIGLFISHYFHLILTYISHFVLFIAFGKK